MGSIWSHSNESRFEAALSLCASLSFHALLFLVLCSTSAFDLSVGDNRFDIFWISPSSAPLSAAASAEAADRGGQEILQRQETESQEAQPEGAAPLASSHPDTVEGEQDATPRRQQTAENLPPVAMAIAIAGSSITAPPDTSRRAVSHHDAVQQKHSSAGAKAPDAGKPVKTAAEATAEMKSFPDLAKEVPGSAAPQWQPSPQTALIAERMERAPERFDIQEPTKERLPDRHGEQQGMAREPASENGADPEQEKVAALLTPPGDEPAQRMAPAPLQQAGQATKEADRPARQPPEPKRLTASDPSPVPAPAGAQAEPAGASREGRQTPTPQAAPVDVRAEASGRAPQTLAESSAPAAKEDPEPDLSGKPPETKGISIASLHGDLKMVIDGDSGIRLLVFFREYPKSRRNRVPSRSESRREQAIAPVFVKTRHGTREAVIETAREGIYTFSAESEMGETAKASFTLKIFETGTREKVTAIGFRTVSRRAVLAKVLMPDAVVWDDDSAFTGSLEDSDSITKFNAQTGLYWKEYND